MFFLQKRLFFFCQIHVCSTGEDRAHPYLFCVKKKNILYPPPITLPFHSHPKRDRNPRKPPPRGQGSDHPPQRRSQSLSPVLSNHAAPCGPFWLCKGSEEGCKPLCPATSCSAASEPELNNVSASGCQAQHPHIALPCF